MSIILQNIIKYNTITQYNTARPAASTGMAERGRRILQSSKNPARRRGGGGENKIRFHIILL